MRRVVFLLLWLAGACVARYDALSVAGEWMIGAYKSVFSPLQGTNICNFSPTCSQFARAAIKTQGFLPGVLIGADRLMRCNTIAWSYYDSYYAGEVINGRMSDPVECHIAWRNPPGEPGLLVAARPASERFLDSSDSLGMTKQVRQEKTGAAQSQFSLSFADYLYSAGKYREAAAEYLRVRFGSQSDGPKNYAGLMAGESYLQAQDLAQARHAFRDLDAPQIRGYRQYGIARTDFAAADYAGARADLTAIESPVLTRRADALAGWTFFRQHRFAEGASTLAAMADDEPSRSLSTMDGRDISRRSRFLSVILSAIVPGAGQVYSGRAGDGAYSFLTVASTGLVAWWFAADPSTRDRTRVKVSIFGVITALFYAGNVYGANTAARDYNLLQERRYVQRADSLFELMSLRPDYHTFIDSLPPDTAPPGRE